MAGRADADHRPPPPSTTVAPPAALPGTWSALPPAGVTPRFGGARAWTGKELLAWGGSTGYTDALCQPSCGPPPVFDGVVFDPAANRWRTDGSQSPQGGGCRGVDRFGAGHLGRRQHRPDPRRRRRPPPTTRPATPGGPSQRVPWPGPGSGRPWWLWAARSMSSRTGPIPDAGPQAAALDPATGTWRVLPDPPANGGLVASGRSGERSSSHCTDPAGRAGGGRRPHSRWSSGGSSDGQSRPPTTTRRVPSPAAGCGSPAATYAEGGVAVVTIHTVDLATGAGAERPGPGADARNWSPPGPGSSSWRPCPTTTTRVDPGLRGDRLGVAGVERPRPPPTSAIPCGPAPRSCSGVGAGAAGWRAPRSRPATGSGGDGDVSDRRSSDPAPSVDFPGVPDVEERGPAGGGGGRHPDPAGPGGRHLRPGGPAGRRRGGGVRRHLSPPGHRARRVHHRRRPGELPPPPLPLRPPHRLQRGARVPPPSGRTSGS